MTIPALDARGLLPPGIHPAPLESVPLYFCTTAPRWHLWEQLLAGLDPLCQEVQRLPGARPTLVLGGSFFSDKHAPADIEATLRYPPGTAPEVCWHWTLQHLHWHAMLETAFRIDFYPSLPGSNDFSAFFQYVGPKTAQAKGLREKDPRGVIEVLDW